MLHRGRSVAAVVVVALAGSAWVLADQTPAQRELRQRHVYVNVVGPNDAPVKDLKVEDVIVREDDRAREVLQVAPAPPAGLIALLIDDSSAATDAIHELRLALLDLSRYLLALPAPPQVGLTTFGERPVQRVQYTTSLPAMQAGIGKLFAISGAGSYFLEALLEVTNDFRKRRAERPMIVAFVEDGGPEFSSASRADVARELKASGATLWVITLQRGSPAVNNREWQERSAVMHELSKDSGGTSKTLLSNLAIGPAFTWVTTLLTTQHRITYSRADTLVPPTRLSVDVRRPNLKVLATRWAGQ